MLIEWMWMWIMVMVVNNPSCRGGIMMGAIDLRGSILMVLGEIGGGQMVFSTIGSRV